MEFLQGQLWRLTGRPQATNLVAFGSLLGFIVFLRAYLKIDLRLATVALLAVPMIQIHATISYVDLPANAALAIVLLIGFRENLLVRPHKLRIVILALVCAAIAANSKPQLIVVAPIGLIPIAYAVFRDGIDWGAAQGSARLFLKLTVIGLLGRVVFTPTKNFVVACIEDQHIIDRILAHLREKEQEAPALPCPALPCPTPPRTANQGATWDRVN